MENIELQRNNLNVPLLEKSEPEIGGYGGYGGYGGSGGYGTGQGGYGTVIEKDQEKPSEATQK